MASLEWKCWGLMANSWGAPLFKRACREGWITKETGERLRKTGGHSVIRANRREHFKKVGQQGLLKVKWDEVWKLPTGFIVITVTDNLCDGVVLTKEGMKARLKRVEIGEVRPWDNTPWFWHFCLKEKRWISGKRWKEIHFRLKESSDCLKAVK